MADAIIEGREARNLQLQSDEEGAGEEVAATVADEEGAEV
jgi:hypothetical protein